jgi:hypothetical protein
MKEQNNNHNMMYLSIVAIVAIVAMVILFQNGKTTTEIVVEPKEQISTMDFEEENLVGEAAWWKRVYEIADCIEHHRRAKDMQEDTIRTLCLNS